MIRPATTTDGAAIAGIYNYYVRSTIITFETEDVTAAAMAARIAECAEAGLPWLVWEEDSAVLGYAYGSKWKGRCAYRFSVEATVYVHHDYIQQRVGSGLYEALIARLRQGHTHAVMGGIALPNPGSVKLHERLGFEKVAHFKEVGFKFDRWIDVGYWQLIL